MNHWFLQDSTTYLDPCKLLLITASNNFCEVLFNEIGQAGFQSLIRLKLLCCRELPKVTLSVQTTSASINSSILDMRVPRSALKTIHKIYVAGKISWRVFGSWHAQSNFYLRSSLSSLLIWFLILVVNQSTIEKSSQPSIYPWRWPRLYGFRWWQKDGSKVSQGEDLLLDVVLRTTL